MLLNVLQQLWRRGSPCARLIYQGRVARDSFRWDEAARLFRAALEIEPDQPAALAQFGMTSADQGEPDAAIRALRRSLGQRPDDAVTRAFLAGVLRRCGEWGEARAEFERAVADDPACGPARSGLLLLLMDECDWPAVDRQYAEVLRLRESMPAPTWLRLVNPYESLLLPYAHAERLAIARAHAADSVARAKPASGASARPVAGGRLRIGYLSGDFRDHPVGHLVPGLFELHDRSVFEVFAYSYGPDDGSVYRRRLAAGADRFVDIRHEGFRESARRIADDGIAILVDLAGHTAGHRLAICAARPAPIQAHYLGFPGTTGAGFIDYFVTDSFVSPPGQDTRFSERLVRLPPTFMVGDPVAAGPVDRASRAGEGLAADAIVFCCFNRNAKITPAVFDAWMEILKAVPRGVLWLKLHNAFPQRRLLQAAEDRGVSAGRLVFAKDVPEKAAHMARHRLADLFLDTFGHYNAHTTAADALWAGLPVLTCASEHFAGRVAGSLVTAAGMSELVTATPAGFVAAAVRIAATEGEIDRLKARLAANRGSARFFDVRAIVAGLEDAYREMWALHIRGEAARTLYLG